MGKSFNDDVFNSNLNLDSINGLSISQEAIEENKKKIDQEQVLDSFKEEIKKTIKTDITDEQKDALADTIKKYKEEMEKKEETLTLQEQVEKYKEQIEAYKVREPQQPKATIYTKKTMIFKQEYLDIIDGLALINDMQIKDVLNQLLEKAINELDATTKEKALKESKKSKAKDKTDKSIF